MHGAGLVRIGELATAAYGRITTKWPSAGVAADLRAWLAGTGSLVPGVRASILSLVGQLIPQ